MMLSASIILSLLALGAMAQQETSARSITSTSASSTIVQASRPSASMTAQPSMIRVLYPGEERSNLGVSIIAANACNTTYAIGCLTPSTGARFSTCVRGMPFTYTAGSDFVQITTQTVVGGASGTARITCNIEGTTRALCTGTVGGSAAGQSLLTTVPVQTLTGSDVATWFTTLPVTGGAELLTSTAGTCTVPHNTGAPSGNSAPKRSVIKTIYKVAVVPAALAAGAALF